MTAFTPFGASFRMLLKGGTTTRNGIIYEVPRTDEPMGDYFTQFFQKRERQIEADGEKRVVTYYWHEPDRPQGSDQKFPLVMVLHGAPGNAYAAKYLIPSDMQRDFPAFIFAPMAPITKTWALSGKPQSKMQSLPDAVMVLKTLIQENPIDTDRIYVIGCSIGGIGAYGAAFRYPNIFAAAVPISAKWKVKDIPPHVEVPIWILHGAKDTGMPVTNARAMEDAIKRQGGEVKYTEFPDMYHSCPASRLYEYEMWEWLFQQKKTRELISE